MLKAFFRKPRHLEICEGDISSAGLEWGSGAPCMDSAFYRFFNHTRGDCPLGSSIFMNCSLSVALRFTTTQPFGYGGSTAKILGSDRSNKSSLFRNYLEII